MFLDTPIQMLNPKQVFHFNFFCPFIFSEFLFHDLWSLRSDFSFLILFLLPFYLSKRCRSFVCPKFINTIYSPRLSFNCNIFFEWERNLAVVDDKTIQCLIFCSIAWLLAWFIILFIHCKQTLITCGLILQICLLKLAVLLLWPNYYFDSSQSIFAL